MKARILYIEDDSMMRGLLASKLEEDGYGIAVAEDGAKGLQLAADNPYDLILLDLLLPGVDGHEVMQKLKETMNKDTPIIVLSNLEVPTDDSKERSLGVLMHLVKASSTPEEIVATINRRLQK